MQNKKTFFFLIGLGLFIGAFSFFVTSGSVIEMLHHALRSDKKLNDEILFWLKDLRSSGMLIAVLLCVFGVVRLTFWEPIERFLDVKGSEEVRFSQVRPFDLFLISAIALFAELLVIRWLSVEMRVFAYFKNVPLISCFLGIGLGAAMANQKHKHRFYSFPFWFSLFAVIVAFLGPRLVFLNPAGAVDFIWGIGRANTFFTQVIALIVFVAIFVFIFVWNTRLFMTLGMMLGRFLSKFPPLKGYSIDILGSLCGIWAFTLTSYFSTPPLVWFAIVLTASLWFLRNNLKQLVVMALVSIAFLAFLAALHDPQKTFWSPYYKISLNPVSIISKQDQKEVFAGYSLRVNEDSHQTSLDYSDDFARRHFDDEQMVGKEVFELPYRMRPIRTVLIVGAGMGPDVAAALRMGAEEIDAVEIDPMILKIGKEVHPEHPYDSPKVRAINDDARSFFKKTNKKYDLVVFGLLDSHTQFSSFSNLRLDNYVYTQESLEDAKALLKPGGIVFITFAGDAMKIWIGQRFYTMLQNVFETPPIAFNAGKMVLISGEGVSREHLSKNPYWAKYIPSKELKYDDTTRVIPSTDDWPFLYMKTRSIPAAYWAIIIVLLGIAWGFTKKYLHTGRSIEWHFFFLGTAFLLLETKAITELALVFGTTWIVNTVVFSGIMILILLGNYAVRVFKINRTLPAYIFLAVSLLFSYFFHLSNLSALSLFWKLALSVGIVLLPVFFAAIVFAVSFKKTTNISNSFGSNLLGAVLGGFVEYLSLITGIRFLALLALGSYGLSFLARKE